MATYTNVEGLEDFSYDKWDILLHQENTISVDDANNTFAKLNALSYQSQYNEIVSQYDALINDSSYKGINLLQNNSLTVRFSEDGNSKLDIEGKDMSSVNLGITQAQWSTVEDIAYSVTEMRQAISSLRSFATELGNNYSIVQNRQEFTETLINLLTEGSDKLILADMNEESANMLALQTRQQLAINALSLSSQGAQAVLKLF